MFRKKLLKKNNQSFLLTFLSLLFFTAASIYITYPLIFHLGNFSTGLGDELVISWTQNWVIHSLFTDPRSLFEANLYFPYHNTLAYSDLHFVSSILAIVPLLLVGQPIVVINFTLISSLVFLGFSLYSLCFYLTKNFWASLLSGTLVIFSPAVLDKTTHLQILAIEWVPFSILFFLLFLDKQKSRYLLISLLFFVMQTYNSFMPGYFILFSYIAIFITKWLQKRNQVIKVVTKRNIFLVIFSFILLIPIIIPYYTVSKEFNYTRDIRDAVHFALQPEDLFYTNSFSRSQPFLNGLPFNLHAENGEFKSGYLGLVFTLLVCFVLYRYIRYFKKNGKLINIFVILGLFGFILSLGPVLHLGRQTVHIPFLIPLPYSLFYYVLPGFQGFRNSARWEMLFILAMSVAIALILNEIFKKFSAKKKALLYGVLLLACIVEFNFPMRFQTIPQVSNFPRVDYWLMNTPKDTIVIFLPIYNWNMWPGTQNELWREYYSTIHFRKMVNGYTGFSPQPWQNTITLLYKTIPEPESVKVLKGMKIDYIIVNKKEYDILFFKKQSNVDGTTVIKNFDNNPMLKFIKQFNDVYVFKILN